MNARGIIAQLKKVTVRSWVAISIATCGAIFTLLPWDIVKVGFYGEARAIGLHFFAGWLVFLFCLAQVIVSVFPKALGLDEILLKFIRKWTPLVTAFIALLFAISRGFSVEYGLYLSLIASFTGYVAVFLRLNE